MRFEVVSFAPDLLATLVSTAEPTLLDAWFRLSFGVEQVYGLCDLAAHEFPPASAHIEIRRMTRDDGAFLARFSSTVLALV